MKPPSRGRRRHPPPPTPARDRRDRARPGGFELGLKVRGEVDEGVGHGPPRLRRQRRAPVREALGIRPTDRGREARGGRERRGRAVVVRGGRVVRLVEGGLEGRGRLGHEVPEVPNVRQVAPARPFAVDASDRRRELVERGATAPGVDVPDGGGEGTCDTPLVAAAAGGHESVVERLCDAGAKVDGVARWAGRTALVAAAESEAPGASVFCRDPADGQIYHTYSVYSRGLDMFITAYHWLDIVPKGRDEDRLDYTMSWLRLHDAYGD